MAALAFACFALGACGATSGAVAPDAGDAAAIPGASSDASAGATSDGLAGPVNEPGADAGVSPPVVPLLEARAPLDLPDFKSGAFVLVDRARLRAAGNGVGLAVAPAGNVLVTSVDLILEGGRAVARPRLTTLSPTLAMLGQVDLLAEPTRYAGVTVKDAAATAAGEVFVVGASSRLDEAGKAAFPDVFVAKFGPDGQRLWLKEIVSPRSDDGQLVAAAPDGSVVIAGDATYRLISTGERGLGGPFLAKFSPGGERLWVEQPRAVAHLSIDDAGAVLLGSDRAITRLDPGGTPRSSIALRSERDPSLGPLLVHPRGVYSFGHGTGGLPALVFIAADGTGGWWRPSPQSADPDPPGTGVLHAVTAATASSDALYLGGNYSVRAATFQHEQICFVSRRELDGRLVWSSQLRFEENIVSPAVQRPLCELNRFAVSAAGTLYALGRAYGVNGSMWFVLALDAATGALR